VETSRGFVVFWLPYRNTLAKRLLPFKPFLREEELRQKNLPQSGRRMIKNDEWIPVILATPFAAVFLYGLWLAWNFLKTGPVSP
jgi:hypothetical protein